MATAPTASACRPVVRSTGNQQTATETGPVSTFWAKIALRGHTATLERLRADRQLEEALTHGPDPLHLAAVFGIDDKTAIRYAEAARQHLETSAERHASGGSPPTQGHSPDPGDLTPRIPPQG